MRRAAMEVTPLGRYGHGRPGPAGFHLGFAAVEPAEIRRGVRELAIGLEAALAAAVTSPRSPPAS